MCKMVCVCVCEGGSAGGGRCMVGLTQQHEFVGSRHVKRGMPSTGKYDSAVTNNP